MLSSKTMIFAYRWRCWLSLPCSMPEEVSGMLHLIGKAISNEARAAKSFSGRGT